jgi:hypothetical protein
VADAKVNGVALAAVAAGGVFVYAGLKGYSLTQTIQQIVQGKTPAGQPQTTGIGDPATAAAGGTGASTGSIFGGTLPVGDLGTGGTNAQNRALGQQMAAARGWTGAQWTALDNLIMGESGWNDTILNTAGSGAAGVGQKITGFDSGYQSGNARQQIQWTYDYIEGRYRTPVMAYSFWLSQSPHWY